jgi:hypothetical protein
MGRFGKTGVVIAGYAAAVAAGAVAAWLYDVRMAAMPYDTSGGMYAGGQLLQSLGAFLVVALVPTLVWLWFLRAHTRLWNGLGLAAIAFATIGLVAVLMPLASHVSTQNVGVLLVSLLALSQLLGVPVWCLAFGLFACLAPTPPARRKLMIALGIELVIGVCALVHWFLPRPPL